MSVSIGAFDFGSTLEGKRVTRFRLEDASSGAYADVLDMGCTVNALVLRDGNGKEHDFALGFTAPAYYERSASYMGAAVGRFANRIGGARFTLDGAEHSVMANEGQNCLHGGGREFSYGIWNAETDASNGAVRFTRFSPAGEYGFPGALRAEVVYTLKGNALEIEYSAQCDAPTVYSPTNHTYFTFGEKDVSGVRVRIDAKRFLETGPGLIPTGAILDARGTRFDVNALDRLGRAAFDNCFVLESAAEAHATPCACAWCEGTGQSVEVFTDRPAIQLYTADGLIEPEGARHGGGYMPRAGLCLETQGYPDAMNHEGFPSCALMPGERFYSKTVYLFSL